MGVRRARTPDRVGSPFRARDAKKPPGSRVVSGTSSEDVSALLQQIARTAARLCEASNPHIYRLEGDQLRLEAIQGTEPMRRVGQMVPITRELPSGCAILDRRTIHVRDTKAATAQRRYPG